MSKALPPAQQQAELLYSQAQVESAIAVIAEQMNRDLASDSVVLLCVMNGGLPFVGQLMLQLNFPLRLDYIHATRYNNTQSGGALQWRCEAQCDLRDQTVIIADDILDEGNTLAALIKYCESKGAAKVVSAVLVEKQRVRQHVLAGADYTALTVPNRYVFGYGMDCESLGRNVAGIYAVADAPQ